MPFQGRDFPFGLPSSFQITSYKINNLPGTKWLDSILPAVVTEIICLMDYGKDSVG